MLLLIKYMGHGISKARAYVAGSTEDPIFGMWVYKSNTEGGEFGDSQF